MVQRIKDGKFIYSSNFMPFVPQMRYIRYFEIGDIVKQVRSDLSNGKFDSIQKSIFEERTPEFLFNIENDFWETHNLVDNRKYEKLSEKMRKELDADILKSRDVMFFPEYEIGLISKSVTPYEFRLDKKRYPLKEIYGAASLSGKRGNC
ncbi:hypothetical protein SAMN05421636_10227 [Pricia antarctica]|uniref:Uncharacterized protein n=1 Tax=Pricia antarctica TaxID=641691 RepID=A0A1G6XX28_9FLAO|nr:hypothetical protein [Pricia antarctica]SDD82582.1 hypothetical protein SAMN05421636_10227 [Pricia antarctica]